MTLPRSDHFNGKTFFQPHHRANRRWDLLRWRLTARPAPWPTWITCVPRTSPPAPRGAEVAVTWIGHASFLIQTARENFLVDPVFSDRASPFTWIGPRRVHSPGIALDNLPRIDVVLLSHDHYDHCDATSLRTLAARFQPRFVAPLRHRELLAGMGARDVVELDWWQSHALGSGSTIALTPTQHWSNRLGSPRNYRLWGGFYLTLAPDAGGTEKRIWFVGDTGYAPNLAGDIRARCGAPDLALVPIGAFEPRWFMAPMHINPAEAVQLHRESGARRSIAMHWGTFQLSDEGRDDPVRALAAARHAARLSEAEFVALSPGESLSV